MPTVRNVSQIDSSGKGSGNLATLESWETREYNVEFTDSTATSMDARNATGIPAWGDALPGYSMYVMEKTADRSNEGQYMWRVTVTYRTLRPNDRQPKLNATHSFWSIVKNVTSVPYELPIYKDLAGNPIVNCLNEAIEPPVTRLMYDAKITINMLTNDTTYAQTVYDNLGYINSKPYTLTIGGGLLHVASQSMMLEAITIADQVDQDGNKVGSVSLEFHIKHGTDGNGTDGWYEYRPNLSYHKSASTSSVVLPAPVITDGSGQPVTEPSYLDANGQVIPDGRAAVLRSFVVNGTSDFDQLLLVGQTPNLIN